VTIAEKYSSENKDCCGKQGQAKWHCFKGQNLTSFGSSKGQGLVVQPHCRGWDLVVWLGFTGLFLEV
jgi:hypothetical protein